MRKSFLCLMVIVIFHLNVEAQYNGFDYQELQGGYTQIAGSVFTDDGMKMFVWELAGKIYVSNSSGSEAVPFYTKQTTPVLDISEEVGNWRDFGFLSVCLDPDFDTNGYIYMFYDVDRHHLLNFGTGSYDPNTNEYFDATIGRLTRYTVETNGMGEMIANPASRLVLLGESKNTGPVILHESHGGGDVIFGEDGSLLVSTGDGASYSSADGGNASETYHAQAIADGIMRPEENVGSFRCQMLDSYSGKIFRLDPATGDGLPSNPFYNASNPRSPASRMWAMGLRNPFRMTLIEGTGSTDPADADPGTLHVGDVGWGTWEDVHVIDVPGLNAGWPLYEGQTASGPYQDLETMNPDKGQKFEALISQPTSFAVNSDPKQRRYTHSRPAIAYYHGGPSTHESRVPWFSGTTAIDPRVGASGSPTTGDELAGYAVSTGVHYTGGKYGSEYQNTFWFSDYVFGFMGVAEVNFSGDPWYTSIEQIGPDFFFGNVVHLSYNPFDKRIYFSNIDNGTMQYITRDATLTVTDSSQGSIKIYPNPAKDYVAIEGITGVTNVDLLDLNGRLIKSTVLTENGRIPLSLSDGFYLLKIESSEGTQTKRLIVN